MVGPSDGCAGCWHADAALLPSGDVLPSAQAVQAVDPAATE